MSFYLGRNENGNGQLHITHDTRNVEELNKETILTSTVFHSELPYLRVLLYEVIEKTADNKYYPSSTFFNLVDNQGYTYVVCPYWNNKTCYNGNGDNVGGIGRENNYFYCKDSGNSKYYAYDGQPCPQYIKVAVFNIKIVNNELFFDNNKPSSEIVLDSTNLIIRGVDFDNYKFVACVKSFRPKDTGWSGDLVKRINDLDPYIFLEYEQTSFRTDYEYMSDRFMKIYEKNNYLHDDLTSDDKQNHMTENTTLTLAQIINVAPDKEFLISKEKIQRKVNNGGYIDLFNVNKPAFIVGYPTYTTYFDVSNAGQTCSDNAYDLNYVYRGSIHLPSNQPPIKEEDFFVSYVKCVSGCNQPNSGCGSERTFPTLFSKRIKVWFDGSAPGKDGCGSARLILEKDVQNNRLNVYLGCCDGNSKDNWTCHSNIRFKIQLIRFTSWN